VTDGHVSRIEKSNLKQIEMLNQRGGRTLSIVDLMRAGTITAEAAGYVLWRVAHGASFLTGAVPGGAGKSTLLADLLGMLRPGERIVTTPDAGAVGDALADEDRSGRCYLCHEIGSGMWYGYLWGHTVADFFALAQRGGRIAACLHADDPDQMREILVSSTLGVTPEAFGGVELLLFIGFGREGFRSSRRVTAIYASDGKGGHQPMFGLDGRSGKLTPTEAAAASADPTPPTRTACEALMQYLMPTGETLFEEVREAVLSFYEVACGAQGGGGSVQS